MRFGRFILIPIILLLLIFGYARLMNSLANSTIGISQSPSSEKSAAGEIIGVGQAVSVQITRATKPYLFGLIYLPSYAQGIGELETLHTVFFSLLCVLTIILIVIFIIIERRDAKMPPSIREAQILNKPNVWIRLGKAIGIGALFALVSYILSGNSVSLPLGLLIAYLEFRLCK